MRSSRRAMLSCLLAALPLAASAECPPDQSKVEAAQTLKPQAVETITSDIVLSPDSQSKSVESFSGAITVRRGARVAGKVETEHGDLILEPGAEVGGRLANEAGAITLAAAKVRGGIATTQGDIDIGPDSLVQGGILVRKRGRIGLALGPLQLGVPSGRSTPPRVVIGPGATVEGKLRFKREVQLFVSDRATIGPIEGATPVYFAGARPD